MRSPSRSAWPLWCLPAGSSLVHHGPAPGGEVEEPVRLADGRVTQDEVHRVAQGAVDAGQVDRDYLVAAEATLADDRALHPQQGRLDLLAMGIGADRRPDGLEQLGEVEPEGTVHYCGPGARVKAGQHPDAAPVHLDVGVPAPAYQEVVTRLTVRGLQVQDPGVQPEAAAVPAEYVHPQQAARTALAALHVEGGYPQWPGDQVGDGHHRVGDLPAERRG